MPYAHRLTGAHNVTLSDFDPEDHAGLAREDGERKTAQLIDELVELQELLYAAHDHKVLVVLQGRDTSGKDGTIRRVIRFLNPQGCSVASFKVPTEEELAHDFLWRIHAHTPGSGHITVFNRSHYEDVLVARVHELVAASVWRRRYDDINAFEKLLTDANTVVLKFFLHISKEEQEKRLRNREKDPVKAWKLSVGDWQERERWNDYTAAYEDALGRCSTEYAPWYIVPANRKWFRDLAVAETMRDVLAPFRERWLERLEQIGGVRKMEIEEYRRTPHQQLPR
jgi:PPK2 family polyphosphate:nucleotide phosphotransferase